MPLEYDSNDLVTDIGNAFCYDPEAEGLENIVKFLTDDKYRNNFFTEVAEFKEQVKELAGIAWDAIHNKGVEVYTAVSNFFSNIAALFRGQGTEKGKSAAIYFEELSETVKTLDTKAALNKEVKQVTSELQASMGERSASAPPRPISPAPTTGQKR